MVVAWSATTPLGQGPDEPAHYVKLLAAGHGHAHGAKLREANLDALVADARGRRSTEDASAQVRALRFVADASGSFELPNALVPEITCFQNLLHRADPKRPADCASVYVNGGRGVGTFTSYVAAYPPYVHVVPGLLGRAAGDDSDAAYWLGRAFFTLTALALLGLALLLLWDPEAGMLSLAGALVAVTPMSLWSFSLINPSGLEIAGALCFTAGLLRIVRSGPTPRWVWAATAAGGVVLATARPSGLVFVLVAPLAVALLFGPPALRAAVRRGARDAAVATGVIGVAVVAALFWQRYMPGYGLGLGTLVDSVWPALEGLPRALRESVGRFAGDYFIPIPLALLWGLLLAGLVAAAALVAEPARRQRLLLLVAGAVVFAVAYATAYLTSGFDEFYGRYLLPGLVVVPLCAGTVLSQRAAQLGAAASRQLLTGLVLFTATIQLLSWWLESRRLAVGSEGQFFFLGDASWTPPGGWLLWTLVFLAGTAAYVLASLPRPATRLAPASRPHPAPPR
jgi:hypothetical protein